MRLWILIFLFLPILLSAAVKRGVKYQSYRLTPTVRASVSFVVVKTVMTNGCDQYGIEAHLSPVYNKGPVDTYVLEYSVMKTEINCGPFSMEKSEKLKSNPIKINYGYDSMSGITILVPLDIKIEFNR